MARDLARALAAGGVRYSRVWEDHLLLEEGLAVGPGDDVLSITGAGCNVLNLLLAGPRSLTAVDLNPAQGALLELLVAAVRSLGYDELVGFLGVRGVSPENGEEAGERLALYRRLRPDLPRRTRAFWDGRTDDVAAGVIHCGRLERYFRDFQTEHLPRLVDGGAVGELLELADPEEQRRLFERRIQSPDFERAFRGYFGRETMARRGRHAAQFRHVGGIDVGAFFLRRFTFACTRIPARGNFYLEFFLTSRYRDPEQVPPYLRRGSLERLRPMLDRLRVVTAEIEDHLESVAPGTYNKVNLSDSCEYLSSEEYERLLGQLASRLRPGGRVVYWNLLVPRRPPERLDRLGSRTALGRALSRRDRAWFYRDFRVEEVLG